MQRKFRIINNTDEMRRIVLSCPRLNPSSLPATPDAYMKSGIAGLTLGVINIPCGASFEFTVGDPQLVIKYPMSIGYITMRTGVPTKATDGSFSMDEDGIHIGWKEPVTKGVSSISIEGFPEYTEVYQEFSSIEFPNVVMTNAPCICYNHPDIPISKTHYIHDKLAMAIYPASADYPGNFMITDIPENHIILVGESEGKIAEATVAPLFQTLEETASEALSLSSILDQTPKG